MNKEQKGNCLFWGILMGIVIVLLLVYFIWLMFEMAPLAS